eukprot:15364599-Ditylum_brightwellii.AAC.1
MKKKVETMGHKLSDEDFSGLGRWSYVEIAGRDQKKRIFTTGYKPCVQYNPGSNTVTAQQKPLSTFQGKGKHSPHKQWDLDFIKTVIIWKSKGNTVFWMGDTSGGLEDDDLAEVLSETELYSIMGSKHSTTDALDTVDKAGMLKFNVGIDSDHRGMFIDINQQHLLCGYLHVIPQRNFQCLWTKLTKANTSYRDNISIQFQAYNIIHCIQQLNNNTKEIIAEEDKEEL